MSTSETGDQHQNPAVEGGQESAPSNIQMPPTEQTPIQPGTSSATLYNFGLFKRHMRHDPLMIVFSILVLAGGIVGFLTKGSSPSLIAGTLFFFLLAAGTYIEGTRRNSYPLLVFLLALGFMMAYRYGQSQNFMPSGLVAVSAFLMFARHAYILYLRKTELSPPPS